MQPVNSGFRKKYLLLEYYFSVIQSVPKFLIWLEWLVLGWTDILVDHVVQFCGGLTFSLAVLHSNRKGLIFKLAVFQS